MSTLPIELVSTTAEEIRANASALVPSMTDRLTDFNDAEPFMVLLSLMSGMIETGNFEMNMRAAELTPQYVRQRPNAVRLFKLIGYNLKGKNAATTTMKLTLASAHSAAIPISPYFDALPVGVKAKGSPSLTFYPTARYSLPAGSREISFSVAQGTKGTNTFSPSPGIGDQIFKLSSKSIAEGSIKVKVNGINWKSVPSFFNSKSTSKHYVEIPDEYGYVSLQFGDGILGAIPSGTIEVVYLVTAGVSGSLFGKGKITDFVTLPLKDINGSNVNIAYTLTNTENAIDGGDEETAFHAKKIAPSVYSAQQRAVTKPDYNAWSESFTGIKQAKAFDINDVGSESFDIDYFQTKIVIIPSTGNYPTASLKLLLQNYLQQLKDVPDNIEVIDPEYVPVVVSCDIYVKEGYTENTVKSNVQTAISTFFSPAESPSGEMAIGGEVSGQVLGQNVSIPLLLKAIQDVEGVSSIASYSPTSNVVIDAFQIAMLDGTPSVNVLGIV